MPQRDNDTGADLLRSGVRRALVDTLANLSTTPGPRGVSPRDAGLTARELAAHVDLHVTTVRFHLDRLVSAGLVEAENLKGHSPGRPRRCYRIAPGTLPAPATDDSFHALAEILAEAHAAESDRVLTPEEAGHRWAMKQAHALRTTHEVQAPARTAGAWLGKLGLMVDLLQAWGYRPQVRTMNDGRTAEIDLLHCPLLPLVRTHPQVVCAVHRGLIRGSLEAIGESETHTSLEPFITETQCRVFISTQQPFTPLEATHDREA